VVSGRSESVGDSGSAPQTRYLNGELAAPSYFVRIGTTKQAARALPFTMYGA
jgi:hypothetical protein